MADESKLSRAVIACSGCQAFIIVLTGLFGIIIHFTLLTGAEKIYVARMGCGEVEGWKDYKCVDFDAEKTYYDYHDQDIPIKGDQAQPWLSSQKKICQKDVADDAWVTNKQTCDDPIEMCQIWVLDASAPTGASASVGNEEPVAQLEATVVDECVAGNCRTADQEKLDARCGLTTEGLIRTGLVYEYDTEQSDMMVPPLPRPAVWMIYKMVQVVRNTGKPMGWAEGGVGHNVELLLDSFPLMHIMIGENAAVHVVSAVADFIKFSLGPTLMLGILTSMEGAPCDGNGVCESNTENMYLSFNADFSMTTWLYAATGIHLFFMLVGSCGLGCCIRDADLTQPSCNITENRVAKVGAAILTFMDVAIVMIGLVTLLTQLSRANIGFAMLFSMAFTFNCKAEVDIFQLFAMFVFFYDVGATILTKMNRVFKASSK